MSNDLIAQVRQEYYRFTEVCQVLGISKMTLWRWVKAGKIKAYPIGQEVLFEKKVIDALRK